MPDYLAMSDEDFNKVTGPEPVTPEVKDTVEKPKVEEVITPDPKTEEVVDPVNTDVDPKVEESKPNNEESPVKENPVVEEAKTQEKVVDNQEEKPKPEPAAVNYEADYKAIMAPFKANGQMIQPKNVQEAIQLMQMGANYTQKMQKLAPNTKLLHMITQNGLDENKLSFLIDIDKKNPEAIKKLLKDANIDPLDLDTTKEPDYREGNHKVNDAEVKFYGVLDELKSFPEGAKTLTVINDNWDQASKERLWDNPELMSDIHTQRELGIYDRIADEVKRLRTVGHIPVNTEFLVAYQHVGAELFKQNAFADLLPKTDPVVESKPTPIATRAAPAKPVAKPNPKVEAASTTRASPNTAQVVTNPLGMSDEEFMKMPPPSR